MRRPLHTVARLAAVALTAGCANGVAVPGDSEYSCAGRPEGVVCRSTREIYALTETEDQVHEADLAASVGAGAAPAPVSAGAVVAPSAPGRDGTPPVEGPVALGDPAALALTVVQAPRRSDAEVVRIWIAPWQDQHGDLRMPGHVYAEIRPRTWSVGGDPPGARTANLLLTPEMITARDSGDTPPAGTPLPPRDAATRAPAPVPPGDAIRRPDFDPPQTIDVRS